MSAIFDAYAYDVKCSEKGPVFQVPITVIKPLPVVDDHYHCVESTAPARLKRIFFANARQFTCLPHQGAQSEYQ